MMIMMMMMVMIDMMVMMMMMKTDMMIDMMMIMIDMMMAMMMMMVMMMIDMMMLHRVCGPIPHIYIYQSCPLHLDLITTHWHGTTVASPNPWADTAVNTVVVVQSGTPPNKQNVLHVLRPLPADPRLHSHTTSTNLCCCQCS